MNYFVIGLTVPGGYYNESVAKNLDYVTAYRTLILKGASVFVDICGFDNYIDKYKLHLPGISSVKMVYSCIGFDILCFWCAFALSFPQSTKRKIFYSVIGIIMITLLNMLRVGGLAMIRSVEYMRYKHIDHHMIFNIVVYILIFLGIMNMVNNATKNIKAAD